MGRQSIAGLCLLLALSMLGCSGEDATHRPAPPPLPQATEDTAVAPAEALLTARFMPLRTGNWWRYRQTTCTESSSPVISTYTLKIKGLETLDGNKWYLTSYVYPDGQAVNYNLYRHVPSGLWMHDTYYSRNWHYLKPPVEQGARWSRAPGNPSVIKSTGLRITVPSATFTNCVLVETTWSDAQWNLRYTVREWYASGVGVVKSTYAQRKGSDLRYSNSEVLLKTNVGP